MLKYLIWIPGLFWLYPYYVFTRETLDSDDVVPTVLHGLYTGVQLALITFAYHAS